MVKLKTYRRHSNLSYITRHYSLEFRKQRQELENCGKYQPFKKFLRKNFAIQITLDCRTTSAVDFKSRLGFNLYNPIMTQEQPVLSKIKTILSAEKIIFQYCVFIEISKIQNHIIESTKRLTKKLTKKNVIDDI